MSTSQGSAEPPCARIKGVNREVSGGKTDFDHGLFSSYEGRQGAANGEDSWGLFRDAEGVGRLAPASPAQGLHHHGPRYFKFPYFCMMCGLEKLGLVDQN